MSRRNAFRIVPALVASLTLLAIAGPTLAQATATAHTAATTVNVTASDFKFKLSVTSAKPGKVTFDVTNKGAVEHDFKIDGSKTPMIKHGKTATLTVTFKKAGSYPYLCTVPGHAQLGMKGTFKIT